MPTPIRNNSSISSNSTGLITWSGDCIPCLGIKTGDNLNAVVYSIATKLCDALKPEDVSTLTVSCALNILGKDPDLYEPDDLTLIKVLQLLLDNDCKLKELIQTIQDDINGQDSDSLTLRLECLSKYYKDNNGIVNLPYDEQSILQNLIDELCQLTATVTGISSQLAGIKSDIEIIKETMPSGEEVIVTTTVSGPKVVSEALKDVSKAFTDYKAVLGTAAQAQTAITRQQTSILGDVAYINKLMANVPGWIPNPTTEAQSVSNLWLVIANLLPRVAANEECCAPGCDDVKIDFITEITGDKVVLIFSAGAGTFIPEGFTDCGSVLTIRNSLGITKAVNIKISQEGETLPIDLSIFKMGDILDFNIDAKICGPVGTCQQCINRDVKYVSSGCCVITATDDVTIMYSTETSNI